MNKATTARSTSLKAVQLVLFVATILTLTLTPAFAQRGDREGHVMEDVWKHLEVPESPTLSPAEGLASLSVAPGFRVELVASEPLIEDPIAMRWDARGRLWVVEMRGFMPDVDGKGEQEPVGQVVVLEDLDHDGRMDKSTPFLDHLVLARALAIVEDGVLIGEPPNLWLCRDKNDDLVCDEKIRVAAFGDPGPDALEHTENGLMWALDNWIYNAKSDRRFRWRNNRIEEGKTHFRGQWGISQDDWGRLYYNTNSRYLFVDLVPANALSRNPNYSPSSGGKGVTERVATDEAVFSIRPNPGINRGYMKEMLRDDGRLAVTTSVSGVCVYRGQQFPDSYSGSVFIPEPAGNAVTFHRLTEPTPNIKIDWQHATYDDKTWGKREFLASTDERFRPVDCNIGPDGALYIIDMYRGILQHQKFVTTFLRKQILERGLDKPVGLGRIYRVVHDGSPIDHHPPSLETQAELIAALGHENGWFRDTAQQRLVERGDPSAVPALESLLQSHDDSRTKVHALWTLHGINRLLPKHTLIALESGRPPVQIAALQAGGDKVPLDKLAQLLGTSSDQGVRVHAAYAIASHGGQEAQDLLIDLLLKEGEDLYLRQAALSGLAGAESRAIDRLADTSPQEHSKTKAEIFSELSKILEQSKKNARPVQDFDRGAARLAALPAELRPANALALTQSDAKIATEATAPIRDEVRMSAGKRFYSACESCHGSDGAGLPGTAPGLAEAGFVNGDQSALIRIVLNGLEGPLESGGETWDDMMPGFKQDKRLTDEAIASLLTYIRGSWGNNAGSVDREAVAQIRLSTSARSDPWAVDELRTRASADP